MGYRTKLDYSSNRQISQREKTDTILSGSTVFGLPFSGLTVGPDLNTSGITSSYGGVISTFSGNSTTTVYNWFDPRMQEHPAGGKYVSSDGWWPDHNNPKYSSEWEDFEFDDFTELKRSRIPNDSFRELRTRRDFDKLRNPETGKVHIRRNPNAWNNYQSGRHNKR